MGGNVRIMCIYVLDSRNRSLWLIRPRRNLRVYVRFSIVLFHSIFDYYAFDLIRLMDIDTDEQGLDGTYWVSAWTARVCPRLSLHQVLNELIWIGSGTDDGSQESPGENHLRIVPTRLCKFRRIHELFSWEICSEGYVLSSLLLPVPLMPSIAQRWTRYQELIIRPGRFIAFRNDPPWYLYSFIHACWNW